MLVYICKPFWIPTVRSKSLPGLLPLVGGNQAEVYYEPEMEAGGGPAAGGTAGAAGYQHPVCKGTDPGTVGADVPPLCPGEHRGDCGVRPCLPAADGCGEGSGLYRRDGGADSGLCGGGGASSRQTDSHYHGRRLHQQSDPGGSHPGGAGAPGHCVCHRHQ